MHANRSSLVMALLTACASGASSSYDAAAPARAHVEGSSFAAGTVGDAANGYWLDMSGVRRWYAVIGAVSDHVRDHPEYRLKLNMELKSPLAPYLAAIEADTVLKDILRDQHMPAREFAVLTVSINGARISEQLVDSLGAKGRPVNLGGDLLAFWKAHRAEIDSLDGSLRER